MKLTTLTLIATLALAATATAGCGKDLKVSIRPSEAEKEGTSVALVRKVDVTYHDPEGKEQVHESLPVLGLSQSVSLREDLLKDVKVEKDGLFAARGYSADGLLLLQGEAHADPDTSEGVEIVLDRQSARASHLGATLLRRVRVADARLPTDFVRDAKDVRTELDSQRCLELPPLVIDEAAGAHPKIILEGAIKAPSFSLEIGVALGREALKTLGARLPVPINSAGDAELELGRRFLEGALLRGPARLILKIHSDHYEGCLDVRTHPSVERVEAHFLLDRGVGMTPRLGMLFSVGTLNIYNPNSAPVFARLTAQARSEASGERLRPCFHLTNAPQPFTALGCPQVIEEVREVRPGESVAFAIFGALTTERNFTNSKIQLDWSVMTGFGPEEQPLITQVPPSFIP